MRDWQATAEALARLAEDQAGTPEGETAKKKLRELCANHPEALAYRTTRGRKVVDILTGANLVEMKRAGVSLDGKWSGGSMRDAVRAMVADYDERYSQYKTPKLTKEQDALTSN